VTPFCAFMDRALDEGMIPLRSVRLYYGAKTTDLLIYRELAERCAARFPQFSATLYAEEGRSEDSPTIRPGLLNLADVFSDLSAPSETSFYISGPMGMIDSFRRSLLNEPAVTADQILLDSWE
jgi:ferredoxin-NADP reductase